MGDDAKANKRDWFDILNLVSTLLIPVVIAVGGTMYAARQADLDATRLGKERDFERDLGYIKMLASGNENEKKLGMGIIEVSSRNHTFSPDLTAILDHFAGGDKDDPLTQAANRILHNQQTNAVNTSNVPVNSAVPVYIQIAREEQRADAMALQAALRNEGFATPGIELVTSEVATVHTYVRFFSASGALQASRVNSVMKTLGYASAVQDFSAYSQSPLSSIEIWVGKSQGLLAANRRD